MRDSGGRAVAEDTLFVEEEGDGEGDGDEDCGEDGGELGTGRAASDVWVQAAGHGRDVRLFVEEDVFEDVVERLALGPPALLHRLKPATRYVKKKRHACKRRRKKR